MLKSGVPKAAIVDYGLGNMFSVKHACEKAGLKAYVTSRKDDILSSDAVILPGVGAFGDAMSALRGLDLIDILRETAASSKPFIGICLGMQLLMTESYEFGRHEGLDIIKGRVVRFNMSGDNSEERLKVPQVGWNRIYKAKSPLGGSWEDSFLDGINDGEFMYFVHSFYVRTEGHDPVLSTSRYGDIEFCSSLRYKNIFACQFHPEKSGKCGLQIYRNIASFINRIPAGR